MEPELNTAASDQSFPVAGLRSETSKNRVGSDDKIRHLLTKHELLPAEDHDSWLHAPNDIFHGCTPAETLLSGNGSTVEAALERLADGVYS